jgi:hypothetical protein
MCLNIKLVLLIDFRIANRRTTILDVSAFVSNKQIEQLFSNTRRLRVSASFAIMLLTVYVVAMHFALLGALVSASIVIIVYRLLFGLR